MKSIKFPYSLLLLLPVLFFSASLQAQDSVHIMSLQQSIDYALRNQSSVKSSLLDELTTEAKEKEVTGLALPQINATGQFQDYLKLPTTLFPDFFSPAVYSILKKEDLIPQSKQTPQGSLTPVQFGTQYNVSGGVSLSQTLFDPSIMVALQAKQAVKDLAHKSVLNTERDVKVNVSKAYYNILIAQKQLHLSDDNIARLEKLLHDTKIMYQNGFSEKLDVDRLNVQLNNLKTQQTQAQNMVTLSHQLLKYQMGMPLKDSVSLTDTLSFNDVKEKLLADTAFDYNQRIDYQLLNAQKTVNQYDLRRYKLAYLPTFSATANYSINAARTEFNFFDGSQPWFKTFLIGLQLNVPIFDGLQKKYRVQQAKIAVQKNNVQLNALKESIDLEQQQAVTNLSNNLLTVTTQEKNMQLAEEVYKMTVKKYEQGVGSTSEINNAQGDLQQAQLNYYNALYNAMIAKVDYQKAFGNL